MITKAKKTRFLISQIILSVCSALFVYLIIKYQGYNNLIQLTELILWISFCIVSIIKLEYEKKEKKAPFAIVFFQYATIFSTLAIAVYRNYMK